ncbi:hypothetical protein CRYUN_Cryun33cG0015800 [Craigia yunnanensis]
MWVLVFWATSLLRYGFGACFGLVSRKGDEKECGSEFWDGMVWGCGSVVSVWGLCVEGRGVVSRQMVGSMGGKRWFLGGYLGLMVRSTKGLGRVVRGSVFWNLVTGRVEGMKLETRDETGNENAQGTKSVSDLTRNYLSGYIPFEWGSMQLIRISLLGNRLTGSIPQELGNLSNLTHLVLEQNQLSETLPEELGNLSSIERMLLNSNNFTGELPETFARLTTLTDFRINDNNFVGKIPHFIQNWKKLELHMHASGLSGSIPSAIDALENITDLRISDLNGAEGPFPPLSKLTKLERLSCNLIGGLPDSLGELKILKQL